MKKLKFFSLAVLVLSLLAIPAAAQKGKDRDNKGGVTPQTPAQTWSTNKTPSKGKDNDKNDNKGKRKGFTSPLRTAQ